MVYTPFNYRSDWATVILAAEDRGQAAPIVEDAPGVGKVFVIV